MPKRRNILKDFWPEMTRT